MWVLHVQGLSAGAGELSEESIGVSRPTSQPTHLAREASTSHLSKLHILPSSAPYKQDSHRLSFHNNWGSIAFASWGKTVRHHPEMPRRCRGKHQRFLACGLRAFTVAHGNHSWWPGQSTGVLGRQALWGLRYWCGSFLVILVNLFSLSHHPVLFFFSPNPLSDFSSLSFIYHFLQNVNIPERSFTEIKLFYFVFYCHSNYLV